MTLSSAVFKLYSRSTSDAQVELAKAEIDHFIKVFEKYGNPWNQTYNLHCLLHLYEDRKNFGPLFFINAYSYENQFQLFKNMFTSPNIRIESLVKRVKESKLTTFTADSDF